MKALTINTNNIIMNTVKCVHNNHGHSNSDEKRAYVRNPEKAHDAR